ncbi:glycosyltransferase [Parabacteroides distasonis]|nr:glycosyltransferase [Parabacteroides distasonis]
MKNISILVSTLDSGGAEKQAVLLSVMLSSIYSVSLIVLFGEYPEYQQNIELLRDSNVRVYKLKGNIVSKAIRLHSILKDSETSVLFNYLSLPNLIGSIIGKIVHVQVYNGIRSSKLSATKEFFEKWAHNVFANGTVFNSYSGAIYFGERGFAKDKSFVIPNCFPNIAGSIRRADREVKTIITVGRFDEVKDYKTLIASVSKIDRNDFRLCIVGYGVLEKQIREWIKQYGIEEKTDIHIKPNNVADLERNADIYISTSLFEGTSNSIMEAMNWSLPIVATKVGDNDHLVHEGVNGYLHPVGDVSGIAGSLHRLLSSVELRNRLGERSNQNLKDSYSIEVFKNRYIELIEGSI